MIAGLFLLLNNYCCKKVIDIGFRTCYFMFTKYMSRHDISRLNMSRINRRREFGRKLAKKFASELSAQGLVIASGMAKGIDTAAHIGALKQNGKTIAVLGNGLNYIFPQENKKLYNMIYL